MEIDDFRTYLYAWWSVGIAHEASNKRLAGMRAAMLRLCETAVVEDYLCSDRVLGFVPEKSALWVNLKKPKELGFAPDSLYRNRRNLAGKLRQIFEAQKGDGCLDLRAIGAADRRNLFRIAKRSLETLPYRGRVAVGQYQGYAWLALVEQTTWPEEELLAQRLMAREPVVQSVGGPPLAWFASAGNRGDSLSPNSFAAFARDAATVFAETVQPHDRVLHLFLPHVPSGRTDEALIELMTPCGLDRPNTIALLASASPFAEIESDLLAIAARVRAHRTSRILVLDPSGCDAVASRVPWLWSHFFGAGQPFTIVREPSAKPMAVPEVTHPLLVNFQFDPGADGIITVLGPPGSGRSTFAMQLAQSFRGITVCVSDRLTSQATATLRSLLRDFELVIVVDDFDDRSGVAEALSELPAQTTKSMRTLILVVRSAVSPRTRERIRIASGNALGLQIDLQPWQRVLADAIVAAFAPPLKTSTVEQFLAFDYGPAVFSDWLRLTAANRPIGWTERGFLETVSPRLSRWEQVLQETDGDTRAAICVAVCLRLIHPSREQAIPATVLRNCLASVLGWSRMQAVEPLSRLVSEGWLVETREGFVMDDLRVLAAANAVLAFSPNLVMPEESAASPILQLVLDWCVENDADRHPGALVLFIHYFFLDAEERRERLQSMVARDCDLSVLHAAYCEAIAESRGVAEAEAYASGLAPLQPEANEMPLALPVAEMLLGETLLVNIPAIEHAGSSVHLGRRGINGWRGEVRQALATRGLTVSDRYRHDEVKLIWSEANSITSRAEALGAVYKLLPTPPVSPRS